MTSNQSQAQSSGSIYEGVVCNGQTEGLAWCDDDFTVVWCSDDTWWAYDCSYIGAYCDVYYDVVDCYY